MDFQTAQAGAILLATAILYSPKQLDPILFGSSGSFPRTESEKFPFTSDEQSRSPWTAHEVQALAGFLDWSDKGSIKAAIDNGFFGTSVGLDPFDGGFCIRLYCNHQGHDKLSDGAGPKMRKMNADWPYFDYQVADPIDFAAAAKCPGGSSISAQAGLGTGTLGAWLRTKSEGYIGISNNHVAADLNCFWQRSVVIHPGKQDGGGRLLGRLKGVVPLHR